MSFPAELSNAVDGVTEIVAAHLNNLEAKVGIDNSAVVTSLDYLLKNAGSIDPGHKHTSGALSGGNDGEVLYKTAGAWGPGTPDAAGLVAKSGDQDIAGVKTFTSIPVGPASNPTTDNHLARKAYVDLMLPLAGGTMAGDIAMGSHKVTGLAAASGTGEALRYDEWIAAQDPGHKHSRLWHPDGSQEGIILNSSGQIGLGTSPAAGVQIQIGGTQTAYYKVNVVGTQTSMGGGNWLWGFGGAQVYAANSDISGGMTISQALNNSGGYTSLTNHCLKINNPTNIGGVAAAINYGLYIANQTYGSSENFSLYSAGGKSYFAGYVGLATTNPGYLLTCNGEPGANGYSAWTNYSDIRFKQDIKPFDGEVLAKVLKLNPVTFTYNDKNPWGEKPGERTFFGFVAQELQKLFPDMVGEASGPDGEKYLTTNLSNLSLYLVQAIKEQQAQIMTLQAKLN